MIPAQSIRADRSLAPLYVLTNIVMNEFENIVIQKLLGSGVTKFYCKNVDDTLLLINPDSLAFAVDEFLKVDRTSVARLTPLITFYLISSTLRLHQMTSASTRSTRLLHCILILIYIYLGCIESLGLN